MLTQEMGSLVATYTIGCVATVRPDGAPAVSPKATFLILDERTIAFANIRFEGTVENLRCRGDVEVNFNDVFAREGCRVRGRARYILGSDAEPALHKRFERQWPDLCGLMQSFVLIDVTEAQALKSSSYDLGVTVS